jgi:hypothetical protein
MEGYTDKRETAAKPELTKRLFFSRTAMSKEPVPVGRMEWEKVGFRADVRFSLFPELLAFSL